MKQQAYDVKKVTFLRKVCSDHEVVYCEWMDIAADVNVLVNGIAPGQVGC